MQPWPTQTHNHPHTYTSVHTVETLDKLVCNWASGESLTLSMQLVPPDRSYTVNRVDSKKSNLWLSQHGLIRSVQFNIFGRRFSEPFWWFLFWPKVATGQKTSSQLRGWSKTGICVHQMVNCRQEADWNINIYFYDIRSLWGMGGQLLRMTVNVYPIFPFLMPEVFWNKWNQIYCFRWLAH